MATTTQVRKWWADARCTIGVKLTIFGRFVVFCEPRAVEALRALEATLIFYGYSPEVIGSLRRCPTGISGKRCRKSGFNCSLHNYGPLAWDFDPFGAGNPHFYTRIGRWTRILKRVWGWGDTKFTLKQVRAVEAIRTNSGHRVFRWLGDLIGDTMHWEINCHPDHLASGIDWSTVPGGKPNTVSGDDMFQPVSKGDDTNAVATWQRVLLRLGADLGDYGPKKDGVDGVYGPAVAAAVKKYAGGNGEAITEDVGITLLEKLGGGGSTVDSTARKTANAAKSAVANLRDHLRAS